MQYAKINNSTQSKDYKPDIILILCYLLLSFLAECPRNVPGDNNGLSILISNPCLIALKRDTILVYFFYLLKYFWLQRSKKTIMTEIVIYTAKDGHVALDVSLAADTVWLSMAQMVQLFARDKSVISRHLNNIFKINELERDATVAYFATVQKEGAREVTRKVEYYNLDAIISVGYRVNSKEGVQFRKWATQVLKEHLIRGYTTYDKRLAERGVHELQQTVQLLQKTLVHHDLVNDLGQEAIQLILAYTKTWNLLLAYDEDKLKLPEPGVNTTSKLTYPAALSAIASLKTDLGTRNEATHLFGQERDGGLDSILNNIEQTFDGVTCLGILKPR